LQQAHVHLIATGERRPVEDTLHDFEIALRRERLSEADFTAALQKGSDHLPVFLNSPEISFTKTQKAELPFAHQEVMCGNARLTGKIDIVDIDQEHRTITISDYKTGKPALTWTGKGDGEKQKMHHYRQQLLFYCLLVSGSKDYHNYDIKEGRLA